MSWMKKHYLNKNDIQILNKQNLFKVNKCIKVQNDSEMRFESNLNTIINYNITEEQILVKKYCLYCKKLFSF